MPRSIGLILVCVLAASAAAEADLVDNPLYKSWSSHGVGTRVMFKQDMKMGAMSLSNDVAQTLKQITPEFATVEISVTVDMGGAKHENKQAIKVAAKVEAGTEYLPAGAKGTVKETGSATVTAAGKSYECKVMEFTSDAANARSSGKLWTSGKVPGNIVKNEVHVTSPQDVVTAMTLTGIEEK